MDSFDLVRPASSYVSNEQASWRMKNDNVGNEDRAENNRGVAQSPEQHPDDGERGRRIPGRDVERTKRVDIAGPFERDIARGKHHRISDMRGERTARSEYRGVSQHECDPHRSVEDAQWWDQELVMASK